MTSGLADNLLMAIYLSAKCPVFFAPAMDLDMYRHPTTRRNIVQLQKDGGILIDAESGELASGLDGKGRMAEPENILKSLEKYFVKSGLLHDKTVMITAGPTKEFIDPVRYITNASSGKMGYALATEVAAMGAHVKLISGPVNLDLPSKNNIEVYHVNSAEEMYECALKEFEKTDIAIFSAAVADYTPKEVAKKKIKKKGNEMIIELVKTHDIAGELGKLKKEGQFTVGFALETDNELTNAQNKLKSKNFDMVILNSLQDQGAGFGVDTNKITIIELEQLTEFELKPKKEVAKDIIQRIAEKLS